MFLFYSAPSSSIPGSKPDSNSDELHKACYVIKDCYFNLFRIRVASSFMQISISFMTYYGYLNIIPKHVINGTACHLNICLIPIFEIIHNYWPLFFQLSNLTILQQTSRIKLTLSGFG